MTLFLNVLFLSQDIVESLWSFAEPEDMSINDKGTIVWITILVSNGFCIKLPQI